MREIKITVREKTPFLCDPSARIVSDNNDYRLIFDFDDEWSAYKYKTVFAVLESGDYLSIITDSDAADLPAISGTRFLSVGVSAGDIKTSRYVRIPVDSSVRDIAGISIDPPEQSVYDTLMKKLNEIESGAVSEEAIKKAVNEYLTEHPYNTATKEAAGIVQIGDYISVTKDGVISAEVGADSFSEISALETINIFNKIFSEG